MIMKWLKKFGYLQFAAHVASWVPLAVLVIMFFNNQLTFNPIQYATQRTGDIALVLLGLSLVCSPIYTLFKYAPVLKLRRPLGLYAFLYAAIHFFIFTTLDYGLNLGLIWQTIVEKPFILLGMTSGLMLLAMAITSFKWFVRNMGKNWKYLHRMVYLTGILVVIHFGWARKGDLFNLSGDIAQPLLAGALLLIFLALRLPFVKRLIRSVRTRLSGVQPVVIVSRRNG
jgi:methionine sulfoxide reductase heme-binding subunit